MPKVNRNLEEKIFELWNNGEREMAKGILYGGVLPFKDSFAIIRFLMGREGDEYLRNKLQNLLDELPPSVESIKKRWIKKYLNDLPYPYYQDSIIKEVEDVIEEEDEK